MMCLRLGDPRSDITGLSARIGAATLGAGTPATTWRICDTASPSTTNPSRRHRRDRRGFGAQRLCEQKEHDRCKPEFVSAVRHHKRGSVNCSIRSCTVRGWQQRG